MPHAVTAAPPRRALPTQMGYADPPHSPILATGDGSRLWITNVKHIGGARFRLQIQFNFDKALFLVDWRDAWNFGTETEPKFWGVARSASGTRYALSDAVSLHETGSQALYRGWTQYQGSASMIVFAEGPVKLHLYRQSEWTREEAKADDGSGAWVKTNAFDPTKSREALEMGGLVPDEDWEASSGGFSLSPFVTGGSIGNTLQDTATIFKYGTIAAVLGAGVWAAWPFLSAGRELAGDALGAAMDDDGVDAEAAADPRKGAA